jgi:hypothetical protein
MGWKKIALLHHNNELWTLYKTAFVKQVTGYGVEIINSEALWSADMEAAVLDPNTIAE